VYSIYYCLEDEIFYIGDSCSVQLFTKDGICQQRIGEKGAKSDDCLAEKGGNRIYRVERVYGMRVINDRLFVCDLDNQRIQIFRRKIK